MKIIKQPRNSDVLKQSGFSLIELMVALTLGIMMVGVIYQLLISAHTANKVIGNLSELQETGRFSMEIITKDLHRAGYYGGNANLDEIGGSVGVVTPAQNTCASAGNGWGTMLAQHISGLNDTEVGYECISDTEHLRGDILTIRYATPWVIPALTPLNANDLYLRSTLFQGRVFRGSEQGQVVNTTFDLPNPTVHQLIAHSYFVGASTQSCDGQAIPALFWQSLINGIPVKEELLTGVEHLQLEYGIDDTGDGSPNRYFDADDVTNWDNITTVRVSLLVRSECKDLSYSNTRTYQLGDITYQPRDSYHRQLFTTTITVRNINNNS